MLFEYYQTLHPKERYGFVAALVFVDHTSRLRLDGVEFSGVRAVQGGVDIDGALNAFGSLLEQQGVSRVVSPQQPRWHSRNWDAQDSEWGSDRWVLLPGIYDEPAVRGGGPPHCRQVQRYSQPSDQPGAMRKYPDREPLQHLIQVERDPLVSSTAIHDKVELGSSLSDGVPARPYEPPAGIMVDQLRNGEFVDRHVPPQLLTVRRVCPDLVPKGAIRPAVSGPWSVRDTNPHLERLPKPGITLERHINPEIEPAGNVDMNQNSTGLHGRVKCDSLLPLTGRLGSLATSIGIGKDPAWTRLTYRHGVQEPSGFVSQAQEELAGLPGSRTRRPDRRGPGG